MNIFFLKIQITLINYRMKKIVLIFAILLCFSTVKSYSQIDFLFKTAKDQLTSAAKCIKDQAKNLLDEDAKNRYLILTNMVDLIDQLYCSYSDFKFYASLEIQGNTCYSNLQYKIAYTKYLNAISQLAIVTKWAVKICQPENPNEDKLKNSDDINSVLDNAKDAIEEMNLFNVTVHTTMMNSIRNKTMNSTGYNYNISHP